MLSTVSSLDNSSSLQITIKSTGAGNPLQPSGNGLSSSSSAYGGQQAGIAEQLANVLTALLFGTQGQGGTRGGGLFDQNGSGLLSDSAGLLGAGLNAANPNAQLGNLLLKALSDILDDDTQQNGQNGLFGQKQPTDTEKSAYTQGVKDALSAILGDGYSQSAGNSSPLTQGNGLSGLNGESSFNQLGGALGLNVGQQAGLQALNDISTHNDSPNRYFVDTEDRELAKEIGQFMDQYPEKFGKPEYQKDGWPSAKTDTKSWAEALSNPDDDGMTKASMDKFLQATGIIKSAVAGDSGNANLHQRGNGGSSLGIDAATIGDRIINIGLEKLAS
ncbi:MULTISPECIES: type III secretion protein HrpN [unclassified Brenneria]|uniref:type III secretion protein HrpN n=1 Tax=unclassified Brenneria TaxID=2634434 RepID=UPI0029C170A3|nr:MULTISPECIES: type III secretion protein HrpN [unclassified Brenneria]MDX5626680.1 type III secretion protein HrpN [Brenneria sp. L3-3Z]MDX5693970.1 type III secretion protein HrpN [Brenneria sp. L4-2C]